MEFSGNFPTLFLSHGAPNLVLTPLPARQCLLDLGASLSRPHAIVVASAHYDEGPVARVTSAPNPRTIHDFNGFDPSLHQMSYPAPGAPDLADKLVRALSNVGLPAQLDDQWGFDHGTWVPLMLMYPQADVPVIALSIDGRADPRYHLELGRALTAFRGRRVLVIGSGAFTHNLGQVAPPAGNTAAPDWVDAFADWMGEKIQEGDETTLLEYREKAPFAQHNHPTAEHLLPMFVAMGAAGQGWRAQRLHTSVSYRILRMDMFRFD